MGMSVYNQKPERFLQKLHTDKSEATLEIYCAGFELEKWRCEPFAVHLLEWLPDYALPEEELNINHANSLAKIREAAARVYTSDKYKKRGEAGEIALHAICRDFFDTIPISPRVFYKSASNDVVKAFDLVHARFIPSGAIEIWLGESKLYNDPMQAINDAIKSVQTHLEEGFLKNQKILLGPQIPKSTPRYEEIRDIFKERTSLDTLLTNAVFVVGVLCNSDAAKAAKSCNEDYIALAKKELSAIAEKLNDSTLPKKIRIALVYIPLADKKAFVSAFDAKLKGLQ